MHGSRDSKKGADTYGKINETDTESHTTVCFSDFRLILLCFIKINNIFSYFTRSELEVNLLKEKHKEEMGLCKLQLKSTSQHNSILKVYIYNFFGQNTYFISVFLFTTLIVIKMFRKNYQITMPNEVK